MFFTPKKCDMRARQIPLQFPLEILDDWAYWPFVKLGLLDVLRVAKATDNTAEKLDIVMLGVIKWALKLTEEVASIDPAALLGWCFHTDPDLAAAVRQETVHYFVEPALEELFLSTDLPDYEISDFRLPDWGRIHFAEQIEWPEIVVGSVQGLPTVKEMWFVTALDYVVICTTLHAQKSYAVTTSLLKLEGKDMKFTELYKNVVNWRLGPETPFVKTLIKVWANIMLYWNAQNLDITNVELPSVSRLEKQLKRETKLKRKRKLARKLRETATGPVYVFGRLLDVPRTKQGSDYKTSSGESTGRHVRRHYVRPHIRWHMVKNQGLKAIHVRGYWRGKAGITAYRLRSKEDKK